jgi:hypothetical protein
VSEFASLDGGWYFQGKMRSSWLAALLVFSAPVAQAAEPDLPRLGDAAAFKRICDAVRTEGSVRFEGDEVERGRARADFKRRRDQVLAGVYINEVPSNGFGFGEYDFDSKKLPVDLAKPLRTIDGVDLLPLASEDDMDFALAPDTAKSIVQMRASGKLKLRVTFRLAATAELADPCVRIGGGRMRMRIDPLAIDLVGSDGRALSRVESPRYRDAIADFLPVAKPHVQVPKTTEVTDPALLKAIEHELLACYKQGLTKNARLRGSLVVGVDLDKEGRVSAAHKEIDAIGDDSVVGCTLDHFKSQRFPKGKPHLSVSVYFKESD